MNNVRQALSDPERLVRLRRACCELSPIDPSEQAALAACMLAERDPKKLPRRLDATLLAEVRVALNERASL